MATLQRHSYREQQEKFGAACDWITALGIKLDATRVGKYARDLVQITEFHESGRIDELIKQHSFPSLINSLVEAGEFIDLHEGLKNNRTSGLVSRLRKFASGSVMASDEKPPGNVARNIGFELTTAATAATAGLPIDLDDPSDIWIPLGAHPIAVECKRPVSHGKVETRIKEGFEQLVKRYESSKEPEDVRGILALSISRIESDGSTALHAQNESELRSVVTGIFDNFRKEHGYIWENCSDDRTLAIMLSLRAPCFLKDPSLLIIHKGSAFGCICYPDSPNRKILESFSGPIDAFAKSRRFD